MNYTTGNITFVFGGLTPNMQYSVFYFVTVDNPAVNAKHSEVMYLNLMTSQYLTVDLFGEGVGGKVVMWIGLIVLAVMMW